MQLAQEPTEEPVLKPVPPLQGRDQDLERVQVRRVALVPALEPRLELRQLAELKQAPGGGLRRD